ncbi:hypothetical protein GCM10020358_23880 [Amorphoplanes nipponensis]|uniref:Uncharacterized protein n=1 Tax=Actinoplanes nipponensis TaxID=135950 RepID=A0A919JHG4_9ACTN|nr:hypothetical protein [Actinoplanes nipponensis]GIE51074.1 hypothetical protein Ani05nite_46080 [Actinoplanes nipponensis]
MSDLPFLDEHRITIAAPRDVVWAALCRYADSSIGAGPGLLTRLLGTDPPRGFAVTQSRPPQHLGLGGRHRFSRYLLTFDLADGPDGGTRVSARSYAEFPGLPGLAYRTAVIGSRGHVLAVRRMLHGIRRQSLATPS